jgi:hypothetical protein
VIALLDACVLYTATLRNLLMWAASNRLYQARWTDAIHEEWIGNLLEHRPELDPAKLQRTRRLMNAIHEECLVKGYEYHIPTLSLPDPDDRHVLAAAIESKASIIVTVNLSDFPRKVLSPLGIQTMHPDSFLVNLFQADSTKFLQTVHTHRTSLQKPAQTVEEYLETLKICGLRDLAALLAAYPEEC